MDLFGPHIIEQAKSVPLPDPKPARKANFSVDWREAARNVNFQPLITKTGSGPTIRHEDRALLTTPFPLHHQKHIVICAHCKRPVLSQVYQQHVLACTRAPARRTSLHGTQAAARTSDATLYATIDLSDDDDDDDDDDEVPSARQTATRKRKNDQSQLPQKPKRQKSRAAKPKPVFNADKQCGVITATGQPCARSLTCKAHSMGAKRAVQGRSQPYDALLLQYQRSNLVKQASISTKEALAEHDLEDPKDEHLTPEAELAQIMSGIAHTHRVPLDRKVMLPTRSRTQLRLREMLSLAMLPQELNASGDAIFGRSLAFSNQPPYNLQFVRAPAQRFQAQRAALMRKKQEAQKRTG